MHKVRDQQGRFISSFENPRKTSIAGHSQEVKEKIQPNYLTPIKNSLARKRPESSTHESKTIQVFVQTKISSLEDLTSEKYHFEDFIFPDPPKHI